MQLRRYARRLAGGLAVAGLALAGVEGLARLALGPPPSGPRVAPGEDCAFDRGPEVWRWHCTGSRLPELLVPVEARGPRLVVLGGSSVNDPFSDHAGFPEQLAAALPGVEVLNLGRAGARLADLTETARALGPLRPDLVVVYAGHNEQGARAMDLVVAQDAARRMETRALLGRSWVFTGIELALAGGPDAGAHGEPPLDLGAPPGPHTRPGGPQAEPPPPPPDVGTPAGPPLGLEGLGPGDCVRGEADWRGTLVVDDARLVEEGPTIASEAAAHLDELLGALEQTGAQVFFVPPISNVDHPPGGTLARDHGACEQLVECVGRGGEASAWERIGALARERCGEDAAWTAWAEAHAAWQAGDMASARSAWETSLDRDPVPLRASARLRAGLAEAAAGHPGVRVVELDGALGGWTEGWLFDDQLHLSEAGAAAVAEALLPEVRGALDGAAGGLPAELVPPSG